ncbi:hypothetical protein M404DRAFT_1003952 [Pisolithus tinctorius Marx 270]|uniref:Uncharacterized protein n=1 Tax=Pisolithus tinctorius Marx 270 TaxID=870435 RepID=A0A0C3NYP8_PISTI|nr:hypothetical protein M404DRAFT_1003952 [Pisolithus tinctorius Marx 270]
MAEMYDIENPDGLVGVLSLVLEKVRSSAQRRPAEFRTSFPHGCRMTSQLMSNICAPP